MFENAKFGDKYLTRDNHLTVYLYKVRGLHLLVVNNGYNFDVPYTILVKDNGIKFDAVSSNYDIIKKKEEECTPQVKRDKSKNDIIEELI